MNKLVSVIITAYNEEKYIAVCLDSLLKQDYKPLEIIIVDDGSTDNTKKFVKHFPDIKLFILKHQGTARARNFASEKAQGEILVFVDADMEFDKNFIFHLVKPINDNKVKGTFSKLEYVANWEKPLARCWNRNNYPPLPDKLRVRQDKNEGDDFRAILKSEFFKVKGFDDIGYTDTWTLVKKLRYYPANAPGAIYYHNNPDSLKEIYEAAKWIGKREYKMNKIGALFILVRSFIFLSLIKGFIKGYKYKEIQFVPFQLVYDFGVTIGVFKKMIYGEVIK